MKENCHLTGTTPAFLFTLKLTSFNNVKINQVYCNVWLFKTWGISELTNDHIYRMVKESNSNIQYCIWPIRTHYTFVSTNDYIYRILTAPAWYSSHQLLPSYIWSLIPAVLSSLSCSVMSVWEQGRGLFNSITQQQIDFLICWTLTRLASHWLSV